MFKIYVYIFYMLSIIYKKYIFKSSLKDIFIDFGGWGRERDMDVRENHWLVVSFVHPD